MRKARSVVLSAEPRSLYRPRNPRATPLYFSCKTRELCPSCAARRAAATAVLLREEVLEEVGHAQWVFVMPKMLRPYFLHHRELLGGLARAAWETVREL
ncbi:MAG: transposase zinc-binding domain-containing protein, partial [Acidobacteria bacterium]|nr:transposase zinc-binding domain-containing protein [Candidatus Sulfomarinibacter sp. MAG AM1]